MENNCTVLFSFEKDGSTTQADIMKDLESSDPINKRKAVKSAIKLLLQGEKMDRILMHVIRFCITCDDHQLKKLLMLYWVGSCSRRLHERWTRGRLPERQRRSLGLGDTRVSSPV